MMMTMMMEEVMYFELCTHRLQVVPKAGLVPIDDYREVERPWGTCPLT